MTQLGFSLWNQLEESYQTDPLQPEDPLTLVMERAGSL